jgi:hypothetical protein
MSEESIWTLGKFRDVELYGFYFSTNITKVIKLGRGKSSGEHKKFAHNFSGTSLR